MRNLIIEIGSSPIAEEDRLDSGTYVERDNELPPYAEYVDDSGSREEDIEELVRELPEGMFTRDGDRLTYVRYPAGWLDGLTERFREAAAGVTEENATSDGSLRLLLNGANPRLHVTYIYFNGCETLTEWLLGVVRWREPGAVFHIGGTLRYKQ